MSTSYKPKNYNTVSPYLIVDGANGTIEFLKTVFSAVELRRFPDEAGNIMHSEVRIDDTVVMIADSAESWPPVPSHVHIYVKDVDATYKRALEAGATSVQEPVKKEDEDKRGGVKDAGGTTWWISTKVEYLKQTMNKPDMPVIINYVAFLRGINVGGVNIKMDRLRAAFEALGFADVKTVLASGNVLFATPAASESALESKIKEKLQTTFGRKIGVLVRKIDALQQLAEAEPFAGIEVTPQTRLYVTFLADKPKSSLKIPYESADGNFKIIRTTEREVCSVLTLTANSRTVDLMSILEKEYGKQVTTRNWNTINRILKAGGMNRSS